MKREIAVFVLLLAAAGFVFGSGGQSREKSVIITEDGEVILLPPGIDLDDCWLIPASAQAGINVYFCTDDDGDD